MSQKLYILGYGFDETNNARIGLTAERNSDALSRSIFFTNFGGHNRVSIAAARAMSPNWNKFLPLEPPIQFDSLITGQGVHQRRWEMSTKNVYDALNEDFESLESMRGARIEYPLCNF